MPKKKSKVNKNSKKVILAKKEKKSLSKESLAFKVIEFQKSKDIEFQEKIFKEIVDQINPLISKIVNKFNGTIVEKFFKFKDFLTMRHKSERDKYYHVWYNRDEFDWYISRPIKTKEMVDKIFEWIEQFK